MAKSGFKSAVGVFKSVNKVAAKAGREAAKHQRQQQAKAAKAERDSARLKQQQEADVNRALKEQERNAKQLTKTELAKQRLEAKASITRAKDAYEFRCQARKLLCESIIDQELK
jgi:hypothetical protein